MPQDRSPSSAVESEQSHSDTLSDEVHAFSTYTRLLILVKENQLATAVMLFAAWQAGVFLEAWIAVQSMCGA